MIRVGIATLTLIATVACGANTPNAGPRRAPEPPVTSPLPVVGPTPSCDPERAVAILCAAADPPATMSADEFIARYDEVHRRRRRPRAYEIAADPAWPALLPDAHALRCAGDGPHNFMFIEAALHEHLEHFLEAAVLFERVVADPTTPIEFVDYAYHLAIDCYRLHARNLCAERMQAVLEIATQRLCGVAHGHNLAESSECEDARRMAAFLLSSDAY